MKKKTNCPFLLPKGYLSPSALDLWEKDRREYGRRYFEDEKGYESAEMKFGSRVHKAIEVGEDENSTIDLIAKSLSKYKGHEVETTVYLPTIYGEIPLFGKIDNLDFETKDFKDWKTSKHPWTQRMAENATQIPFYALMLETLTKRRPKKGSIVWLETMGKNENLALTGHFQEFHVEITEKMLEEVKKRIIRACMEIDKAYRRYLDQKTTI